MFWYLAVLASLALLALLENNYDSHSRTILTLATTILVLFVGLRYETGFDWVEYEAFYEYVSSIGDGSGIFVPPSIQMEPGFTILLSFLKTIGLSFQQVLFVIPFFNIAVIAWFADRYTSRPVLALVWYFGFALLPAQMAAIRQGLSFSLVLIVVTFWERKAAGISITTALLACTVHVFSLVIAPLIFLRDWQPKTLYVFLFAMVGVIASLTSVDLLDLVATNALTLLGAGNLIADKLNIYNGGAGTTLSTAGLALTLWDLLFLYLVEHRRRTVIDEKGRVLVAFAVKCALFSVFAHSFLASFPAVWNRISYISMLVEIVVLSRWYETVVVDAAQRKAVITGLSGISAAVLIYGLRSPAALPYTPYQSMLHVWTTGDRGDGRLRYTYAMQQAEREMRLAKQ